METDYYELVADLNKAFEKGDLEFLSAHLGEDVRWFITGSKPVAGKQDFLKCCSEAPFKADSVKITLTNILVDGSKAAAEGIIKAETLHGKPYNQVFCDIYHFNGELIETLSSYLDTAYDRDLLSGGAIYQNK